MTSRVVGTALLVVAFIAFASNTIISLSAGVIHASAVISAMLAVVFGLGVLRAAHGLGTPPPNRGDESGSIIRWSISATAGLLVSFMLGFFLRVLRIGTYPLDLATSLIIAAGVTFVVAYCLARVARH